MVVKKVKIVIIGAGMAGLTAANKLYTAPGSSDLFQLCVVEGSNRIGGRILTSHFGGDRIELGATYIHGINGSPIHNIATETSALHSEQPWEGMDGFPEDPITIAEGGLKLDSSLVDPISLLYRRLMDYAEGKLMKDVYDHDNKVIIESRNVHFSEDFIKNPRGKPHTKEFYEISKDKDAVTNCASPIDQENSALGQADNDCSIAAKAADLCSRNDRNDGSIGAFLRRGLETYWVLKGEGKLLLDCCNWSRGSIEEAIFAMHENTERNHTSAGDLFQLNFNAENEYCVFPGEEITIAKGYSSIIQSLASVLPLGVIQLGRKVEKIQWHPYEFQQSEDLSNGPVKLHFSDGSIMAADHVIVTVSLGVLKAGTRDGSNLFSPLLPFFKTDAISRLGFGVVNKLFLQLDKKDDNSPAFPFLQMTFQQNLSVTKQRNIPWWIRRTASLCPIYKNSRVLLSWFAGQEALELESLKDSEIIKGVSETLSSFHADSHCCNGSGNGVGKLAKVLRSGWGSDPLFLGSYSYVAVGSSGKDLELMAEPLPHGPIDGVPLLQLLFAGEATHRTHYSTTHGAYFSGLREANRLLQHYSCRLP